MSSEQAKRAKEVEKRLKAAKYKYRSGNEGRLHSNIKHSGYAWRKFQQ